MKGGPSLSSRENVRSKGRVEEDGKDCRSHVAFAHLFEPKERPRSSVADALMHDEANEAGQRLRNSGGGIQAVLITGRR
jgi:hypothetical protein